MSTHEDAAATDPPHPGGPLRLSAERITPTKAGVMAWHGVRLFHYDTLDLGNARSRTAFSRAVAAKAEAEGLGPLDPAELEHGLLHLIEELAEAGDDPVDTTGYRAVEGGEDPAADGMYQGDAQISNFVARVVEEVLVRDAGQARRRFEAEVSLLGETSRLSLAPEDLANGTRLMAALYGAGGARIQVFCRPDALPRAIAALSRPRRRELTTDFGWSAGGAEFLTPSVRVDAAGIRAVTDDDPVRVDLADEACARHLDLAVPEEGEVAELKRHVVGDLLRLSHRRATFALLAAVALAVLLRFAPSMNRPALWLLGVTGSGKSFLLRLFANFFGDFPVEDGARLAGWTSTGNSIQRTGYFFKDAFFGVDDFKPESVRHNEVVKLLQNNGNGSARGRLRADATANVSRPIRGLLVSNGEEIPEQSASSIARIVVVRVPALPKDIGRGERCLARSGRYRALTPAFIHHLIAEGRAGRFADRVAEHRRRFYADIAGRQNDLRIAGNFALLAAAFEEMAAFLRDEWPGCDEEVGAFVADLAEIRDEMLAEVVDQQASQVFLTVLRNLVAGGRVQIDGYAPGGAASKGLERHPVVGRMVPHTRPGRPRVVEVATQLALEAVQVHLTRMNKPPLPISEKSLIRQLAGDGKLLDRDGTPLRPDSGRDRTWSTKLGGLSKKVFCVEADELIELPRNGRGGTGNVAGRRDADDDDDEAGGDTK